MPILVYCFTAFEKNSFEALQCICLVGHVRMDLSGFEVVSEGGVAAN